MKFEELLDYDYSFVEDKTAGKPRMKILACVQEAGKVNKNNRLYPKEVLDKATRDFQARLLKKGFGQVDHPVERGLLKDTSHLVTKLFWDEKNSNLLNAEMIILNTQAGEALKEIVKAGGRPGLSSRGQGDSKTVKKNGKEVEVISDGFKFDGFDFVIDPSVGASRIKKVYESVQVEDELSSEAKERRELWARFCASENAKVQAGLTSKSRFIKSLEEVLAEHPVELSVDTQKKQDFSFEEMQALRKFAKANAGLPPVSSKPDKDEPKKETCETCMHFLEGEEGDEGTCQRDSNPTAFDKEACEHWKEAKPGEAFGEWTKRIAGLRG